MITRPQPRSSIPPSSARVIRYGPVTLTRRCRSHDSTVVLPNGADSAIPALFTSTSTGPSSAAVLAHAASTDVASVTSSATASTDTPPPARNSSATLATCSRSRAATATLNPSRTSAAAIARPIPRLPPVTIATRIASLTLSRGRAPGPSRSPTLTCVG